MKRKLFFPFIFAALFIISCNNASDKSSSVNPNRCTAYACPMHPDHTSTVPAKCPECNMDMDAANGPVQKDSTLVN